MISYWHRLENLVQFFFPFLQDAYYESKSLFEKKSFLNGIAPLILLSPILMMLKLCLLYV